MTLLLILLGIFAGVALMAAVSKRFGGTADAGRLQRWLMPLVGLMLLLSLLKYYV